MTEIFRSYSKYYARNVTEGQRATVQPATLENPTGEQDNGVALRVDGLPRLVIRTSDALRIANDIADVAAAQRTHNTQEENS